MPCYSLAQIHAVLGGKLIGDKNIQVHHILTDSRGVAYPEVSLFFAIHGIRHDGHRFIEDLFHKGVRSFVVKVLPDTINLMQGASFIQVDNVLDALQKLAAMNRNSFISPVIGITGSNGKTVVKEWIYQSLHQDFQVVRSPKSFNSQIGVPLSLWQLEPSYNLAIIEAGISQPGEMDRLEKMIRPDIGIFTNLGEPHQENFNNLSEKCAEKLILFEHCKTIIYCKDHPLQETQLRSYKFEGATKFTWSMHQPANLHITSVSNIGTGSSIEATYLDEKLSFVIPFQDEASIENTIHVIALLLVLNIPSKIISERLRGLTPVAMRLELKQGIHHCTLINDSYNSDFGSLTIALDFLEHQHQHSKKTLILSDILQSGKDSKSLYQQVSELVMRKKVQRFIGIGTDLMKYRSLFPMGSAFYSSTAEFLNQFHKEEFSLETILLKGSRSFTFEKILKLLEDKVHETVMEINLNAMVHNLNYFKSKLNPETKIVAMVKAFSYGSGSFEIANLLQFQRVDYLAVAFADEGVSLREAGITMPIMVMNPEKSSFEQIISFNLEPEIYSFRELSQFSESLKQAGLTRYPVHIKIDSGMHRLGFSEDGIEKLIPLLQKQDLVQIRSVFSHLAGSDEAQFDRFTIEQVNLFDKLSLQIINAFDYKILRHILNSAGIERFPQFQFQMVRLGIGLYGISAVDQLLVQEVSTLKTVILQIKDIPIQDTVGYGRKFTATRSTRIGVIPIGYADGLHRILGNGNGTVSVNGHQAPIIGNICMDMTLIDLTGLDAAEGDQVIVFGPGNSILEISRQMQTIPYEVLTSISPRVKRVYYQE